jgi:hypothetical protein
MANKILDNIKNIPTLIAAAAVIMSFLAPNIRGWIGIDADKVELEKRIHKLEEKIEDLETNNLSNICRTTFINRAFVNLFNENIRNNIYLFKTLKSDDYTLTNIQTRNNELILEISETNNKTLKTVDCNF